MNILSIAAVLALTACSTMSDVMPIGQGKYLVGTSVRGGFSSDTEVKAGAIRTAVAYCSASSKQMELVSSQSSGTQGWTPQNAEVIFRCV